MVLEGQNGFLGPREVIPTDFAAIIMKFIQLSFEQRREFQQAARKMWSLSFNADVNFADWVDELAS